MLYTPDEDSFLIVRNYTFLTPLDIVATVLAIILLNIMIGQRIRLNRDKVYYKYLRWAFLFKISMVIVNTLFYIIVYHGGGDSIGYWDCAVKLNNLFWEKPFAYFDEVFGSRENRNYYMNFTLSTGYPDTSVYNEEESFMVSRITSFLAFVTFKGFILISLIYSYVVLNASWKLFELAREFKLHSDKILAFAIFFLPSLSFWCGGISKDSIIFICVCYFIHNVFKIMSPDKESSFINWLWILVTLYFMYSIRSFMILTVLAPLIFVFGARLSKKNEKKPWKKNIIRLLILGVGVGSVLLFFQTPQAQKYLNEAALINQDMSRNETYGSKRYDLGVTDYSPAGMIAAFPASVIASFFRPFIWEALSPTLIINGLESVVIMYFTFRFLVSSKIRKRITRIRQHEFLIYGFVFAVILAYFAGFTSILFGVLVRFKAPVLPFLIIVLTAHYKTEKELEIKADQEKKNPWELT
jgi:hypothetical protein